MRSGKTGQYSEQDFDNEFGGALGSEEEVSRSSGSRTSGSRRKTTKSGRTKRSKKPMVAKKNSKKKTAIVILLSFIILILAGTALGYVYMMNKLGQVDRYDVSKEDLNIDPKVAEDLKDYKNIAILGIDTNPGYGETDETARTDAIIIMSINKKTKEVKLISVYRDSYLDVEENGKHVIDKVNHAHHYGGPLNTIRALNRNLDLNIDDFVRVNWRTVADVVDSMDGLEVTINESTRQELNRCIVGSAQALGMRYWEVGTVGKVKLTGIQIVGFCRMRMADGDDMRAERMREVVNAAFSRMKTMKLSELNATVNTALSQIKTSMSSNDMMSMMMDMNSYKILDNIGWPANYEGTQINEVWYDVPITLKSNVIQLHKDAFGQEDYQPSEEVLKIDKKIKEKSGKYGTDGGTTKKKTETNNE